MGIQDDHNGDRCKRKKIRRNDAMQGCGIIGSTQPSVPGKQTRGWRGGREHKFQAMAAWLMGKQQDDHNGGRCVRRNKKE